MNIPEGYQAVMPYLILKGAEQFLDFAQDVFEAKVKHRVPRDRDERTIMHAEIVIDNCIIMLAEATERWTTAPAGLFIYVADADNTFKRATSKGAIVVMDLADQPYGRSGGVQDPFGNTWWICTAS